MAPSSASVVRLLEALRQGDVAAQGEMLVRYQRWLGLLARLQIDTQFQGKFGASDIVQQTLLEACRDLRQFRGRTEAELLAWLRQILAHVLAHEVRRYRGTQQRDLAREVSLEQSSLADAWASFWAASCLYSIHPFLPERETFHRLSCCSV